MVDTKYLLFSYFEQHLAVIRFGANCVDLSLYLRHGILTALKATSCVVSTKNISRLLLQDGRLLHELQGHSRPITSVMPISYLKLESKHNVKRLLISSSSDKLILVSIT